MEAEQSDPHVLRDRRASTAALRWMVEQWEHGLLPPRALRFRHFARHIFESWPWGDRAPPIAAELTAVEREFIGLPEPTAGPKVGFRIASREDVDRIVELVNAAYRGTGGARGWTTEEHLVEGARIEPDELRAMIADRGSHLLLAVKEDRTIVGSVHLREEPGGSCYLGMLSVDPSSQANGVGRVLMREAETTATAWGCTRMRIAVFAVREELLAFYERRGYRRTGREEPFPTTARSRLKVPGLHFLELEKPL